MSYPADFPSAGAWKISYYDDNEESDLIHTQDVFCTEYLDDHYLMRRKTEHGWDFNIGERRHKLLQLQNGSWTMGTWMSSIVITSAEKMQ